MQIKNNPTLSAVIDMENHGELPNVEQSCSLVRMAFNGTSAQKGCYSAKNRVNSEYSSVWNVKRENRTMKTE